MKAWARWRRARTVRRVTPPSTTMPATMPLQPISHHPMLRAPAFSSPYTSSTRPTSADTCAFSTTSSPPPATASAPPAATPPGPGGAVMEDFPREHTASRRRPAVVTSMNARLTPDGSAAPLPTRAALVDGLGPHACSCLAAARPGSAARGTGTVALRSARCTGKEWSGTAREGKGTEWRQARRQQARRGARANARAHARTRAARLVSQGNGLPAAQSGRQSVRAPSVANAPPPRNRATPGTTRCT